MQCENSVTVSGNLHHIKKEKPNDKYFLFSIRQETEKEDGSVRKDFLVARVFIPEVAQMARLMEEGTIVRISGELRVSPGSGEMYIYAQNVEKI